MFEKEAEEYVNKNCGTRSLPIHEAYARGLEEGFQDGAEFGYNKAKKEIEAELLKCYQGNQKENE